MENPNLISNGADCYYKQAAAQHAWILQTPTEQGFNNTSNQGSVGIFSGSNHVRSDGVDADSFLSYRDKILSKSNPPIPEIKDEIIKKQPDNVSKLQPLYTKETKSAVNLSSISYIPLTFEGHHFIKPQDTKHVIFEGAVERGGLNTSNMVKNVWSSK